MNIMRTKIKNGVIGAAFLAASLMSGCGDKTGGGNVAGPNAGAGRVSNPVPVRPGPAAAAVVTSTPPAIVTSPPPPPKDMTPKTTPAGGGLINGTNPIPNRP